MSSSKEIFEKMFAGGDIKINGDNPWDMKVHNEGTYNRLLSDGMIGLGESYIEGWWDCPSLDEFFYRMMYYRVDKLIPNNFNTIKYALKAKYLNMQTKTRSKVVAHKHYNMGNDLFKGMLDKRMIYTCGYWKTAQTLDEAQEDKLDLVCRKLKLEPGMRMLDLGCGWGGLAKFAAERYGVSVVGVNISEEQVNLAREVTKGLPVEIRLMDYRDINEKFDRVASVGLMEHVGYKNYRSLMEVAARCMDDESIFLLHTIGGNFSQTKTDPWIDKYIFPNGMLPSPPQISTAAMGLFTLEDWHNFGIYYDRTCMEWLHNFKQSWPELKDKYGDTFYRMWEFYLSGCAASFRARKNHLWQVVYRKSKSLGLYEPVR